MKQSKSKPYIWQAAWWRQDQERGRWAATIGLAVVLIALTALVTPGLLERDRQLADSDKTPTNTDVQGIPEQVEAVEPNTDAEALPVLADPEPNLPAQTHQDEDGEAANQIDPPQFVMPIKSGQVNRPYGYDYNPNTEDYRFHRGCDIRANKGQSVLAVAAGTVIEVYTDDYWGGLVKLDHGDGWCSIYKCLEPNVTRGLNVAAGAELGKVVNAPAEAVQESHLHLEVERDGESINPELFLYML